jgi:outer membrane receptor for ferric coprogen and ferric-rhodotorulic acid
MLPPPDFQLSFYHTYDRVRRRCEYTAAFGYASPPDALLPEGYVGRDIGSHRALNVSHTGPYRHLGNAWSAAMGCQRSDKLKAHKTMPGAVDEKEIQTEIYLPVR